jgi:signal recognition particle receptor subunit beta
MAEHVILVAGPMGAGKTTAISSLSGGRLMVSTEAHNTDRATADKDTTTVAMDYSEILLTDEEKVRIYGLPGQKRFAFMWQILKKRATGMILLVNNDAPDPIQHMLDFLEDFKDLYSRGAIIIGISRTDISSTPNVAEYSKALQETYPDIIIPIFTVDPRDGMHMKKVLMSLVANLEFVAELRENNQQ